MSSVIEKLCSWLQYFHQANPAPDALDIFVIIRCVLMLYFNERYFNIDCGQGYDSLLQESWFLNLQAVPNLVAGHQTVTFLIKKLFTQNPTWKVNGFADLYGNYVILIRMDPFIKGVTVEVPINIFQAVFTQLDKMNNSDNAHLRSHHKLIAGLLLFQLYRIIDNKLEKFITRCHVSMMTAPANLQ